MFVSLLVLGEGLGRLIGDPEIETEHLTAVAVAGFCVNLIGLYGAHCGDFVGRCCFTQVQG